MVESVLAARDPGVTRQQDQGVVDNLPAGVWRSINSLVVYHLETIREIGFSNLIWSVHDYRNHAVLCDRLLSLQRERVPKISLAKLEREFSHRLYYSDPFDVGIACADISDSVFWLPRTN
jgi:hypothetical protein